MKRRHFLGVLSAGTITALGVYKYHNLIESETLPLDALLSTAKKPGDTTTILNKVAHFDETFSDDVFIDSNKSPTLFSLRNKLQAIQSHVGYANYAILNYDELVKFAKYKNAVEPLTLHEQDLIRELFSVNATVYGFNGERINTKLEDNIDRNKIIKVPGTGQYVFKGKSLSTYDKLKKDVGDDLVLTSGIRSIVKQLYLFTNKAVEVGGNLSRASRSLAPPGHSFHAIGDFDVGMRGLGERNFTKDFANTRVFEQISKMGYVSIRYHETNMFGVRYEPWHIKVV